MQNKKAVEMRLSTAIVGVFMFSLIVAGLAIPYGQLGKQYNVTIDASFNRTYNKIDTLEKNITTPISEGVKKDTGTFDTFFLAGKTILNIPKIAFDIVIWVNQLINEIAGNIGIPSIFLTAAKTLFFLMMAFFGLSIWARYKS